MALSLGLESMQLSEQDQIYTLSDVLEAELECMNAQQVLTDYINFNEILFSVKKHTSQECIDFAADLLGANSASLEAVANANNNANIKKSFAEKFINAWNGLYKLIKAFFGWLKKKISQLFNLITGRTESKANTDKTEDKSNTGKTEDKSESEPKTKAGSTEHTSVLKLVSKSSMARLASQSEALQNEKKNIKIIEEKIKNYSALFDKETASKVEYTETNSIKQHLRMIERIYGNIYITASNIDAIFKANGPATNRKTANQASVIITVNRSFNLLNKKVINFIRAELSEIRQSNSGFGFRGNERADEANKAAQYVDVKEKEINNLEVNKK